MIISDEQLTQVIAYLRTSEPHCGAGGIPCGSSEGNPDGALIEHLRGQLMALPECREDRVQEVRATIREEYPIAADVVAHKMIARSISDALR